MFVDNAKRLPTTGYLLGPGGRGSRFGFDVLGGAMTLVAQRPKIIPPAQRYGEGMPMRR